MNTTFPKIFLELSKGRTKLAKSKIMQQVTKNKEEQGELRVWGQMLNSFTILHKSHLLGVYFSKVKYNDIVSWSNRSSNTGQIH